MSGLRVALHAFLAYFVCHHAVESFKWVDTGGLGPLCIIPLGLMVSKPKAPNPSFVTVRYWILLLTG